MSFQSLEKTFHLGWVISVQVWGLCYRLLWAKTLKELGISPAGRVHHEGSLYCIDVDPSLALAQEEVLLFGKLTRQTLTLTLLSVFHDLSRSPVYLNNRLQVDTELAPGGHLFS